MTDEATGSVYLARVDFSRLRLARPLRQRVDRGEAILLVGADVRRGDPPLVVALTLDGVAPAEPRPVEAIPEAALDDGTQGGFLFGQLHDLIRRVWGKRAGSERHLAD